MVKNRQRMQSANRINNAPRRRYRQPKVTTSGNVTTVTGSETIGNLNIAGGFTGTSVNINPLELGGTWLARQASLFNKFKYVRARLRYVPFVPTNTQGRVVMAWSGDVGDAAPTTTAQVTQYENSVETPVWMETGVNMGSSRKPEYTVDSEQITENTPGSFEIATDFGTVAAAVGSLYLDYTINFWSRAAYAINE